MKDLFSMNFYTIIWYTKITGTFSFSFSCIDTLVRGNRMYFQSSADFILTRSIISLPMQTKQKQLDISAGIAWILQVGIIVSSIIIILGMALLLFSPQGLAGTSLQSFPDTVSQIWTGLLTFQPMAIIVLGLLILMATPVIRVVASIVAFGVEHDPIYVIITLIVLAILCAGFLFGKGGA
jgi:uncharacterized membrane protein